MMMANIRNSIDIKQFKYWLRINGFHLEQFGGGEKWNPIRFKSDNICNDAKLKTIQIRYNG